MCIFCQIATGEIPSKKVYEDDLVLAFLDLGQVTKGHTLVIPKKHYDNIYDIDQETLKHVITVTQNVALKITNNLNAFGCNILNNNNEAAGQTVKHIHFHVIPRYNENYINLDFVNPNKDSINLDEVLKEINQ